jgi:hypothetical protein
MNHKIKGSITPMNGAKSHKSVMTEGGIGRRSESRDKTNS